MEFKVIGRSGIIDCYKAQELLDKYNFRYEYIDINDIADKSISHIINVNKITCYPIIYVNDKFLGNLSELKRFITLN